MTTNKRPTILIVDDKSDITDTYAIWLRDSYSIRTAYSGHEALEKLDDDVDVVLLDRRMPGLSGDDVLTRLRERELDCRVAMVTAIEPDFDIIEMGFDSYLVKPVFEDDLCETIEELVARSEYDEQVREYFALASKRAVLRAEKESGKLEGNEKYIELNEELEQKRANVDETLAEFSNEDFTAAFRNLSSADDGEADDETDETDERH